MDTVSDLLSRINNSVVRRKESFEMPASKLCIEIAKVMCDEGYLTKQEVVTRGKKKFLRIAIKYGPDKYGRLNRPVITGIKRVSRPGLRAYVPVSDIPRVQDGFGCAILSTPAGVITDEIARQKKVGGEVLAYIW